MWTRSLADLPSISANGAYTIYTSYYIRDGVDINGEAALGLGPGILVPLFQNCYICTKSPRGLIMTAHLALLLRGPSFSSPAYSKPFTTHATLPHCYPPPPKSLKWAMERKDGARWLMHRMVILDGKRKQQIMAATQANGVNSHSQDYIPQADFYKVEAILRPWRLSHVASDLLKMGIRGVTVSDVRGFGSQGGSMERQAGSEFSEDSFVTKVKMEVVVSKDQVEAVIETIIDQARTGEIGDGKIFVIPVADVIRVRTGERGLKAERMAGGRSELLSGAYQDTTNNK